MSPELSSLPPTQSLEIPTLSKEDLQEIISSWQERLPSFPELIQKVVGAALEKMENASQYTDEATKNNALSNAARFLTVLWLYLSSPSYKDSPPQTMEQLIEGLNSFCPNPPFLKPGDIFVDPLGRTFEIKNIAPPGELPSDFKGGYCSGTNMWDSPEGKRFIPGNYQLEKIDNP